MRKNATFQLSAVWWRGESPQGLAAGKELEKALADYEGALKALEKNGSDANHLATLKSLGAIEAAARKVRSEADKLLKNPPKDPRKTRFDAEDIRNTVEVLGKIGPVLNNARETATELREIDDRQGDDADEDPRAFLTNHKAYQAYLRKLLKRVQKARFNFAVGLGKQPEETRFLFHKAKSGKALLANIKKETKLRKFTWGTATGAPEKPGLLMLMLDGPQPPGLKRKSEKLFKALKPLPFTRVVLMVEDREAEDLDDPDDLPEDWRDLKADVDPAIAAALGSHIPAGDRIAELRGLAEQAAAARDYAEAIAQYRRIEKLLGNFRAPPEDTEGAGETALPAADGAASGSVDGRTALAQFNARLRTLLPKIRTAPEVPAGAAARDKARKAGVSARRHEFAQAQALLDEVDTLLAAARAAEEAITAWRETRSQVINRLKSIATDIAAARQPQSARAILKINAIVKQLSVEPRTPARAAELERWLAEDDAVTSLCERIEDIRTPLIQRLTELKGRLSA